MTAGSPTVAELRRAGVISRLRVVRVNDDVKAVVTSAKFAARSAQDRADKAAADVKAFEAKLAKAAGKLGAEKLTPEEQRRRFIEAARHAGASEDEADFEANCEAEGSN